MKKITLILMLTIVLGVLGGCALSQKDKDLINSGDYGVYPDSYEDIIKAYFEKVLFDPFSAHYKFTTPERGFLRKAPIAGGGVSTLGYRVVVEVNAKNRMGGYVGWSTYIFFIRNNQIINVAQGSDSNIWLRN